MTFFGKHARREGVEARERGEAAHPTPDEMFAPASDFAAMDAAPRPGHLIIPGMGDEARRKVQEALDTNLPGQAPRVLLEDESVDLTGEAHVTQGADGGVHVTVDANEATPRAEARRAELAMQAMYSAAETVRQTGGSVEIGGVKIYPCDTYGRVPADAPVYLQPDPRPSLYISGTISSDPLLSFEEAKARFDAARDYLTALGYRAVSPTDMEGECGRTPEECVSTQKKVMPGQGQGNHSWECYLKGDLRAMLLCDGVAVLPNWDRSSGAWLEVQTAKGVGMEVRPFDQWPLVRAAEDAVDAAVDRMNGDVDAVDVCEQCNRRIFRSGGRWYDDGDADRAAGKTDLRLYCPVSKDPDAAHVPSRGV